MKEPAKKVEETSQKDIHLYTAPTMNGWKPVIFLEEAGLLPQERLLVSIHS